MLIKRLLLIVLGLNLLMLVHAQAARALNEAL